MATRPKTERNKPERLSDDEIAYHQRTLSQFSAVQSAFQLWQGHLREKYQLGPEDFIEQDGTIRRNGKIE